MVFWQPVSLSSQNALSTGCLGEIIVALKALVLEKVVTLSNG
jgi:hypothetical protein